MSIEEVLSQAFSGGRAVPAGQPLGVMLDEIRRLGGRGGRPGSRRAAARAIGVSEGTLRRWESGRTRPKAGSMAKVEQGLRGLYRVANPSVVKLDVVVGNAGHGRPNRSVKVSRGAVQRAGDAWQRGDLKGMVREFRAGISDPWYRTVLFRSAATDDEGSEPIPLAVSW